MFVNYKYNKFLTYIPIITSIDQLSKRTTKSYRKIGMNRNWNDGHTDGWMYYNNYKL